MATLQDQIAKLSTGNASPNVACLNSSDNSEKVQTSLDCQLQLLDIYFNPDQRPLVAVLDTMSCRHSRLDLARLDEKCRTAIVCSTCLTPIPYSYSLEYTCDRCSRRLCLCCEHEDNNCLQCFTQRQKSEHSPRDRDTRSPARRHSLERPE